MSYATHRPPVKTSLDFICGPPSTSFSALPSSTTTSAAAAAPPPYSIMTPSRSPRGRQPSHLAALPRDILSSVAYHLVISTVPVPAPHPASPPPPASTPHPSTLVPLLQTCRLIHDALDFDHNPKLYHRLFRATFDHAALTRRYAWMVKHLNDVARRGQKMFDLFSDPRSWAIDYKTRWEMARRMRQVVKTGKLCSREEYTADLWNVWFLLTENDGNNMPFLAQECLFAKWILLFYHENLLKESLVPGYPSETGEKALSVWCTLLSGSDISNESTAAETDEKIFVLRPYVFACAKYDVTYAPWHHRRLPTCPPSCKEHEPDVTMRSKAMPYKRFGYTWRRAPPHFILGVYLVFLRLLERQPGRMGLDPGSSTFSATPADKALPGLFSQTRIMPSIFHDREWQRNSVCQDPHTSPGLPPMTFRGDLEGFWRAKFLFYDFDAYREILAGNMRGVYTGRFAEQAAEMELKETVIRVRTDEVGGDGPMLCAGFRGEDQGAEEVEQRRIEEGYGHEVVTDAEEDYRDEEGWTREILITGRCRTSWGWAKVRGRVRAWDGLIILSLAYSPHVMGRWLWRGYLHTGGHLVGRWRDTFTPEHLRGYEGAFGMVRAGDLFYPPHFPKRMEDSLGVDHVGDVGALMGPMPALLQEGVDTATARQTPTRTHASGSTPRDGESSRDSAGPKGTLYRDAPVQSRAELRATLGQIRENVMGGFDDDDTPGAASTRQSPGGGATGTADISIGGVSVGVSPENAQRRARFWRPDAGGDEDDDEAGDGGGPATRAIIQESNVRGQMDERGMLGMKRKAPGEEAVRDGEGPREKVLRVKEDLRDTGARTRE